MAAILNRSPGSGARSSATRGRTQATAGWPSARRGQGPRTRNLALIGDIITAKGAACDEQFGGRPLRSRLYTEPPGDPDTLANLGPLRPLAGSWEGAKGCDEHPVAEGTAHDVFVEHYQLDAIDFQTNGPQLFYGLRTTRAC